MRKYYTTGNFAKKAGTTERTIRYYDKIGLLKPTKILDNGYRQYTQKDLIKLQRIITLQHLGFSLEDIVPLLADNDTIEAGFKQSIKMQIDIINKKIVYLESLKEGLIKTDHLLKQGVVQWDRIADLIKLSNNESMIVQQYRSTDSLHKRIQLHDTFSINPEPWFSWVYKQIDFSTVNKLLEIGCGNGALWKHNKVNLRHREFFLTDISQNMLDEAKRNLGAEFNYMIMDGEEITFKKDYFDIVIANHILFYLKDIDRGLKEIQRVLKNRGTLYCTVYGQEHMLEIEQLVKSYDPEIYLMESRLHEKLGIENAEEELAKYFKSTELRKYEDSLHINNAQLLLDYIMSCPGNQNEIIGKNITKFKQFISDEIEKTGHIKVTKDVGILICKK